MELEITWSRVIRIWWSYLWRNLLCIVIGMLLGMVFGFIVGFIMGAMGFSPRAIMFVTAPIGFVLGLGLSVVPMKLILGKDYGEFRLVLLAKQEQPRPTPVMPQAAQ